MLPQAFDETPFESSVPVTVAVLPARAIFCPFFTF